MPEIDGFETCRRLKENDLTKDIPVIFMTALSDTQDKRRGFKLSAIDYIIKPFQREEVRGYCDTIWQKPVAAQAIFERLPHILSLQWVYT